MGVIGEGQPEFEAFLNFEKTFDSIEFGVTDLAGNEISNISFTSALGMDYGAASRASAVTEPSTFGIALVVIGFLASQQRIRSIDLSFRSARRSSSINVPFTDNAA